MTRNPDWVGSLHVERFGWLGLVRKAEAELPFGKLRADRTPNEEPQVQHRHLGHPQEYK